MALDDRELSAEAKKILFLAIGRGSIYIQKKMMRPAVENLSRTETEFDQWSMQNKEFMVIDW